MNPLALLLIAAAAGSGNTVSHTAAPPVKLDHLVSQLQGAVNTLERVGELSRIGSSAGSILENSSPAPIPSPAPATAHIPVSADVIEETHEPAFNHAPSLLPNIDLQNAMQTLAPLLSMLGNNQNSR